MTMSKEDKRRMKWTKKMLVVVIGDECQSQRRHVLPEVFDESSSLSQAGALFPFEMMVNAMHNDMLFNQ